jgi:hypothetical protein
MVLIHKAVAAILGLIAMSSNSDKGFKCLDELSGQDTAIEQSMAVIATTSDEFNYLWSLHKDLLGTPPQCTFGITVADGQVPKVDFKKNVVVAYFGGQLQGVAGFELAYVDTTGKTNRVVIRPVPFPGLGQNLLAKAYGMWIFPKPKRTIDLEMLLRYENAKPVTKMIQRFGPPKQAKIQ